MEYQSVADFPVELIDKILDSALTETLLQLAQTCKLMARLVKPRLCRVLCSPKHTLADIVSLLQQRPDIAAGVKLISVEQYHPYDIRLLLAIEMPNLSSLLVSDDTLDSEDVETDRIELLNKSHVQQPKLTSCKISRSRVLVRANFETVYFDVSNLSTTDAALMNHPQITKLNLIIVYESFLTNLPEHVVSIWPLQSLRMKVRLFMAVWLQRLTKLWSRGLHSQRKVWHA